MDSVHAKLGKFALDWSVYIWQNDPNAHSLQEDFVLRRMILIGTAAAALGLAANVPVPITFHRDVLPVLQKRCHTWRTLTSPTSAA